MFCSAVTGSIWHHLRMDTGGSWPSESTAPADDEFRAEGPGEDLADDRAEDLGPVEAVAADGATWPGTGVPMPAEPPVPLGPPRRRLRSRPSVWLAGVAVLAATGVAVALLVVP